MASTDAPPPPPPLVVPDRPTLGSIVAWACWFGLVGGTIEMGIFLLKCRVLDPRNLNVGRQFIWMFPAAGLLVVGAAGVALAIGMRLLPRFRKFRYALFVLSFVAYVGILFRAPVFTSVCLFLAVGLAYRTALFLASLAGRWDRRVKRWLVVPVGLFALTMGWSLGRETLRGSEGSRPESPGTRNVILIVLDTVRADRLGLYGARRETSPNLARFARRGVRFDRAFATAPWTAPSHASLFTGHWPHDLSIGWDRPLDATHSTLAEVLAGQGFATAGFVANVTYAGEETGLARGFAHYEDYDVTLRGILLCSSLVERSVNFAHKHPTWTNWLVPDDSSSGDRKSAARINRDFLGWIDARRPTDRPFFAFLNDFDAHHPYLPPGPVPPGDFGRKASNARDFRLLKTWWERDKQGIAPEDVQLGVDAYDQCLASLDAELGRLMDGLERRGLLERSVVIITADHGEHLGEHGLFGHGCSLYRQELHVPLIVVAPGLVPEGKVVTHPVSLRDVPATAQALAGVLYPLPGRSLARFWDGTEAPVEELVRSEVASPPDDDPNRGRSPASRGPMTSLIDREFHYIRNGDGREELYDLMQDPGEIRNLADRPEIADRLARFRKSLEP